MPVVTNSPVLISLTQDLGPNQLLKFFENFNDQFLEAPSAINNDFFIPFHKI